MRARGLVWPISRETNFEARRILSSAIALDDGFADAIALLELHVHPRPREPLEPIRRTSRSTPRTSSRSAVSLSASRGFTRISSWGPSDFGGASSTRLSQRQARCRELDPNFPDSWSQRGHILHYMGRSAEAIDDITEAIRLDPLSPDMYLHFLAQCHFDLGDDEEAARVLRRRITRSANTDISRVLLAAALGHLGRHEEARQRMGARAGDQSRVIRCGKSARFCRTAIRR